MSGKLTDIRILENTENLCWTFWFNGKRYADWGGFNSGFWLETWTLGELKTRVNNL